MARARCIVAEAEIALASRDLGWPAKALDAARATLEAHGDRVNAAHARYLEVRRLLLIGRLDEAERTLAELDPAPFPPASRAAHELVVAGIAMRRLRTKTARAALARAERAARACPHPGADGGSRERSPHPRHACRAADLRAARSVLSCSRRSKRCWPRRRSSSTRAAMSCATRAPSSRSQDVRCCSRWRARWARPGRRRAQGRRSSRAHSGAKHADESHRARLRVEIGRLRTMLRTLADVSATKRGFRAGAAPRREVVVLARPVEEKHADVLAFLADGEVVVELGARAGARHQPAHRAARARRARAKQARCSRSAADGRVAG